MPSDFSNIVATSISALAPVHTLDMYETVCQHVSWEINGSASDSGILIADRLTFDQHQPRLRRAADQGSLWVVDPKSNGGKSQGLPRALVYLSPHLAFAIIGTAQRKSRSEKTAFDGGWTCSRGDISNIIRALYSADSGRTAPQLPFPATDATDTTLALAQKLLNLQIAPHGVLSRRAADRTDLLNVLSILKTISARGNVGDILFDFVAHIARIIEVDRCSVVRVWPGDDVMHVLASHEDPGVRDMIIRLQDYPEVVASIEARAKIVIADVRSDPLLEPVRESLAKSRLRSILVVPLVLFGDEIGSLLLRVARRDRAIRDREIQFYEIVAEAAGTALERAHLLEKIETANERLTFLATTDGLTNLYNHRFFRERLEEEFERAKRYKLPLSIIMADIDDFKLVNDTFGHLKGDAVLREVANCIMGCVRKSDVVARYGGEEFAIILPQTDRIGAMAEAERLLTRARTHRFAGLPEETRVTLSVGVGVLDVQRMASADVLLKTTDNALYQAKTTGKNRICLGEKD